MPGQKQSNPKIIHRIYFENFAPFHDPFEHYLESWAREMPDYKVMRWNMKNLDVYENEWTTTAFKNKAPVFLSEYFRWKVLAEYGGIYLDADCELLNGKILHGLIEELYAQDDYDVFFGVEEKENGHPTAQTVAAKKGAELVQFMKNLYDNCLPDLWPWREKRGLIGPQLMSLYFLKKGINTTDDGFFKNLEKPIVTERAKVYPQTYFSPKFSILGETLDFQEDKTCVYHMFANSNVDFSKNKFFEKARKQALTFVEYRESLAKAAAFPRRFDASWLPTRIGTQTESGIQIVKGTGVAMYGPYTALPGGQYVAKIDCSLLPQRGSANLAITENNGANKLLETNISFPLKAGAALTAQFSVPANGAKNLEVVLSVQDIDRMTINAVEFDREDNRTSVMESKRSLKTLHRIYFGFDGKPDQFQTYLRTWEEQLPDFKIMHWNASNLPMDINPYVKKLHAEKDHAFLTDFFRWYVLREYGGSYLDADVEIVNGAVYRRLIEELEERSEYDAFIGIDEKKGGWYTAHSMASKPGSEISKFMCELYTNFGSFTAWRKKGFYFWAPQLVALYFANKGHHVDGMGTSPNIDGPLIVAGTKIYPQDWFSPLAPTGNPAQPFVLNGLSENTSLCHHFACSWHDAGSIYLDHSRTKGGQANTLLKEIAAAQAHAEANDIKYSSVGSQLNSTIGIKRDAQIQTNHVAGHLVYGPYIDLEKGRYKLSYTFENPKSLKDTVADVTANSGQKTVVKPTPVQKLDTNRTFSLEFEAKEPLDKVEFRLHVSTKSDFALSNIALTRLA
ncbi:hypothetical protein K6Y74_30420 [Burkholderia cenocepacia]|jgi:mannosyltransferase OCH1-like enzyme|uniref:glycosyltransferase family 32 protein n=1 Tax=Burkholderia cenocepacia TaxID=95486 RepID=UPI00078E217D|nr:glycosyltransferase [Burkholderia cenocepacia]AMU15794.1 hypothetical protein A3203_23130 [Burkholderia cenocepacia]MCW3585767.1 hypothetical protein [Burkholderia cenocepacia]MCW3631015.1 hypothetical protein [Burkholderia cenocepacia]MCW3647593.1 hypothetical protein [Burkholderia cenocepacia]MCW5180538.1 hypothetical protein [Burkholderia cenocepacia]